jgi:hypothetical protein
MAQLLARPLLSMQRFSARRTSLRLELLQR